MNKFVWIFAFVVLFTGIGAGGEEGFPLVSGICLLENDAYRKNRPPGQIAIGLQVREETLFKLSARGRVLNGGIFRKGFNSLSLAAEDFFDRTGTHTFSLECKAGEAVVEKEITIDIRIVPLYVVQKRGEERKRHTFTLSFFFGGRLIYSTKKFPPTDISFKIDLPPSSGRYDPFGLIDGAQKPTSGIPIMGAVAGLYQLAKYLSPAPGKNKEEEEAVQKKQQIETTYLKTNMLGDLWQWRALISLKTSDPDKDDISIP